MESDDEADILSQANLGITVTPEAFTTVSYLHVSDFVC